MSDIKDAAKLLAEQLRPPVELNLSGKIIHPQDGDIIVIYHDRPQEIRQALSAWAASIAFTQASILVIEPGSDIALLDAQTMRAHGWAKKRGKK